MNKTIVVGSINMDIVAFVQNHPKIGETVFGKEIRYFPGGKGSNQAVACRRLGSKTAMIGQLGNDAFAKQLLSFLQLEGIDTHYIKQSADIATGMALITVSDSGENSIVVIPGANGRWQDGFPDDIEISCGDLVLAQFEIPDPVISQAFKKAKASGATTLLNPAPVRKITTEIRELTDVIVVNELELAMLSDMRVNVDDDVSVYTAAEHLGEQGYRTLIVTLGSRGLRIRQDNVTHRIDGRSVHTIDSTGAGDTFIGGLAAGLVSGMNLYKAAELGNVAASISVTRHGAASSIPTRAEVNDILGASQ